MANRKKTRQEKIIASLRREIKSSPTPQTINLSEIRHESISEEKSAGTYSLPAIKTQKIEESPRLELPKNSYFKRDLTKTFILSILAISLELVIYFLSG